ncbi:MAG: hypothetical protein JW893_06555 [Candidatus Omnitrophica bacterium]|nr:hypothetical protein [Candidatus Omnitrophota bacterium]
MRREIRQIVQGGSLTFFLCVVLVFAAGCVKKPKELPGGAEKKEGLPVLAQNMVYLTNRSEPVASKNLTFEDSPDPFKKDKEADFLEVKAD